MAIKVVKDFVSKDKYNIKCPYSMKAEFIVVHNTANDASAENEIAYMKRNDKELSYHFAIDDKEVRQGLPLNRNGWHAGDGGNGAGNRKGIGIEICWSKSGGSKFTKAEKLSAEFIAQLLKERGWGIDKVKKHQDFSAKYCPHRTLDLGWQRFLNMIKDAMAEGKTATETKKEAAAAEFAVGDKVKITGKYAASTTSEAKSEKAKGKTRYIVKIYDGKPNPYQLGTVKGKTLSLYTTGFAPAGSIEIVKAAKKSTDEIVKEVIAGMWGNGMARKVALEKAGYNYNKVQTAVNKILRGK